jgi:hypothetical protein
MDATAQKTDREILTAPQRVGEVIALVLSILLFSFFAYHQAANTGFFTAKFGPQAMFFFYGPMLLSMLAPVTRAVVGRRNPARPLEVATNVFLAIAALWLFNVFPFNLAHLADALPAEIRFLFWWVNDDIGRIVLILQMIVCPVVAVVTTWQYFSHLWREPGNPTRLRSAA